MNLKNSATRKYPALADLADYVRAQTDSHASAIDRLKLAATHFGDIAERLYKLIQYHSVNVLHRNKPPRTTLEALCTSIETDEARRAQHVTAFLAKAREIAVNSPDEFVVDALMKLEYWMEVEVRGRTVPIPQTPIPMGVLERHDVFPDPEDYSKVVCPSCAGEFYTNYPLETFPRMAQCPVCRAYVTDPNDNK